MRAFKIPFLIPRDSDNGHSAQLRTDAELQTGPAPRKITHIGSLQRGKIGPNVNTFPMTGGLQYIGHVPLVQLRRGPSMNPANTMDDRAYVPAIYAGNPIE